MDRFVQVPVSYRNPNGQSTLLMVCPTLREHIGAESQRLQRETFSVLGKLYDKLSEVSQDALPFQTEGERTTFLKEAHPVFIAAWSAFKKFVEDMPTELEVRTINPLTGESSREVAREDLEGLAEEYQKKGMEPPAVLLKMLQTHPSSPKQAINSHFTQEDLGF